MELKPGYVIKVSSKADDGWWYGTRSQPFDDTKSGWFPSNFVITPEDPKILARTGNDSVSLTLFTQEYISH